MFLSASKYREVSRVQMSPPRQMGYVHPPLSTIISSGKSLCLQSRMRPVRYYACKDTYIATQTQPKRERPRQTRVLLLAHLCLSFSQFHPYGTTPYLANRLVKQERRVRRFREIGGGVRNVVAFRSEALPDVLSGGVVDEGGTEGLATSRECKNVPW